MAWCRCRLAGVTTLEVPGSARGVAIQGVRPWRFRCAMCRPPANRSPWWPAVAIPVHNRSASLGELELANIGSSLKFCLLAEGAADCYPRLAPTSQWDTAAAQGVLEGAGGEVLDLNGAPFCYPARESLLNEFFVALPAKAAWREQLLALANL